MQCSVLNCCMGCPSREQHAYHTFIELEYHKTKPSRIEATKQEASDPITLLPIVKKLEIL